MGVNIYEAMNAYGPESEAPRGETVLVYRNRNTGRLREFSLDETEWQDAERWEWVDTRTAEPAEPRSIPHSRSFRCVMPRATPPNGC